MKTIPTCLLGLGFMLISGAAVAQNTAPATPVTATCKDGSSWAGKSRSGACKGHGGVAQFTSATNGATPAGQPAAAPAAIVPAPAPRQVVAKPTPGGRGQVWVNTATKVYHCPGDRYYGNTKAGNYMTEAAAIAAGAHADHGKACSS